MRGSDGGYWVVKFTNNPQHVRVLANEFLACRIGRCLGLPMPQVTPIEVSDWLIENTSELHIECAGFRKPCNSGLQLACSYIADPATDQVFDYLPENMSHKIVNIEDFPRCLVLDKWSCNCDGRQATFSRSSRYLGYRVHFIDQGYCFNAGEWTFPDLALHGVYYRNYVYQQVTGWESFEPTLSRVEQADTKDLWDIAEGLPDEWWNRDSVPEGMPKESALFMRRTSVEFYTSLVAEFAEADKIKAEDETAKRYELQTALEEKLQKSGLLDGSSLLSDPHTTPENESSVVTGTTWKSSVFMFTADAGVSALTNALAKYSLKGLHWMQIPHHGSRRNITETLIENFAPKTAYVSAGGGEKHPRKAVVNAFKKIGSVVYSTHYPEGGSLWHHLGTVKDRTGYSSAVPLWEEKKLTKAAGF